MKKLFLLGVLLAQFSIVNAQSSTVTRKGFSIGGAVGAGVLTFTKGGENASAGSNISLPNLAIGWMLKQDLGIFLNAPGVIYSEQNKQRSFEALIPSVKYFPTEKMWMSAGFGLAMDFPVFYQVEDVTNEEWNLGTGASFGIGVDLVQKPFWTVDLQTKFLKSSINLPGGEKKEGSALIVGVGFNFY